MENNPTVNEMLKKMVKLVCDICDKENATPAELDAMTRVAEIVLRFNNGII